MADEPSSYDRLVDAVVHAPIGFALYARDTAPGFLRLFVARGREELARRRRDVDGSVAQARSIGQVVVTYGPPEVKRRVEGALDSSGVDRACARAVEVVSEVTAGFAAGLRPDRSPPPEPDVASRGARTEPASPDAATSGTDQRAPAQGITDPSSRQSWGSGAGDVAPSSARFPSAARDADHLSATDAPAPASPLPIPDYDELSASQVVEHLEGLDPAELDAIATYERARRGRRTILGKIEQLTA